MSATDMDETYKDYYEKLDAYFKLKQKYEKKLNTVKLSIINNTELSKKEKSKRVKNITFPCISCKRRVGTVFVLDNRIYKAYCGSTESPCSLNIELKRPNVTNIYDAELNAYEDSKNTQNDMIIAKMQLLFGFMNEDEMVELYTVIKEQYKGHLEYYDLIQNFIQGLEKKEEKKLLLQQSQETYYQSIKTLKQLVREYITTQNASLIKDAIELYIQDIKPTQQTIRNTKYADFFIEEDKETTTMRLIKIKKSIESTEYTMDDPEVLNYELKK